MKSNSILTLLVCFVTSSIVIHVSAQTVLYVDDDASAGGDGQSWTTAYRFLQDALTTARDLGENVSEIRVATGRYLPDRNEDNPDGTGDQSARFELISNISIQGGYAGLGAEDPDIRDYKLYSSILSGDLLQDDEDIPNQDNSYHVLGVNNDIVSAVLEGFQIVRGRASVDESADGSGGGMICQGGSITLRDCRFIGNVAFESGGALSCNSGAECVIERCSFELNCASETGGAVEASSASLTLQDSNFEGNVSRGSNQAKGGGALTAEACEIDIDSCTFTQNSTSSGGGGGACQLISSSVNISSSLFEFNTTGGGSGGAVMALGVILDMIDTRFQYNDARGKGGANSLDTCTSDITNCEFISNRTTGGYNGGAINVDEGSLTLKTSEFISNRGAGGGAIYIYRTPLLFNDCNFEANDGEWGGAIFAYDLSSDDLISHCTFMENTATAAGAIAISTGAPIISASRFISNTATRGGAVRVLGSPTFVNSLFTDNYASEIGGAILVRETRDGTHANFVNCTIANNTADQFGGGLFQERLNNGALETRVLNSVLWDNNDSTKSGESEQVSKGTDSGTISIAFSTVKNWNGEMGGIGNVGCNPRFIDPDGEDEIAGTEDDNYALSTGSPVIDAADNSAVPLFVELDLNGVSRFIDDPEIEDTGIGKAPIVDMGAFESQLVSAVLAPLTGVEMRRGVILDGGLDNLLECDDSYLHTISGFGESFIELHITRLEVSAQTDVLSPTLMEIAIEALIDEPTGIAQIRLRNINTNHFDPIAQYQISTEENLFVIRDISAADYVEDNGQILLDLKHVVLVPFVAFRFESLMDLMEIRVRGE